MRKLYYRWKHELMRREEEMKFKRAEITWQVKVVDGTPVEGD